MSDNLGFASNATAGAVSEATAALTYLPTDIVTQRLQVHSSINFHRSNVNSSASKICKHIYTTEGIRGFYRGFGPYILVYGPGSAVWWASYEACKTVIFRSYRWAGLQVSDAGSYHKGGALKILAHLVSGGFAGAAGYIAVNPLEVAKTRLQLLELRERTDKRALSSGYWKLLKDVYYKEGIAGLYKGIKPRLLIRVPVSSVAFIGYEYLKEFSMKDGNSVKSNDSGDHNNRYL
jgi:solute carrier family 25 protein 44